MEYRKFYNGVEIPMLGFGVFQIPEYDQAKKAVLEAFEVGYRLIDTAQSYFNERAVGDALKESGLKRDEVFITTKLWIQDYDNAYDSVMRSVERLGLEKLDLMLLHQPLANYFKAWQDLEKLYEEGVLRSIGMANCYPQVLTDLCESFIIKPMINQVEMHPFFQQDLNLEVMNSYQVVPEAWGPFNEGKRDFFHNEVLAKIGHKYGKSVAQVALRFNLDRGVVVIPKTVHKERMQENFDIFDFKLDAEDFKEIKKLELGHSEIVNHYDPKFIKFLHEYRFNLA